MHVLTLEATTIHLFQTVQIAAIEWNKALTKSLIEYSDYADIFSTNLVMELPENTGINKYAIKLVEGKQPPYRPIYTLSLMKLEILKTYIKTHLKTGFIQSFKFPTRAPILFDKKPDGSLYLYINYPVLNNLIIKNKYSLPTIGESLDRLGQTKQFIQLDLTSTYY